MKSQIVKSYKANILKIDIALNLECYFIETTNIGLNRNT